MRLTRRFDANDFNVAPFDNSPYDTLWAVSNLLCLIPVHCRTSRSDVNAFLDLSLGEQDDCEASRTSTVERCCCCFFFKGGGGVGVGAILKELS